jgi:hypothetical protein
MICGNCQNQITESTARFCPFCGHGLMSVQESTVAPSATGAEEVLVPVRCTKTKVPFIARFQWTERGAFMAASAFPVKEERLRNPGFSSSELQIKRYATGENYAGCPHCGSQGFWVDHSCGDRVCCHDGRLTAVCPWCGSMGELTRSEGISFRGMRGAWAAEAFAHTAGIRVPCDRGRLYVRAPSEMSIWCCLMPLILSTENPITLI